jgi:hypothetical protein
LEHRQREVGNKTPPASLDLNRHAVMIQVDRWMLRHHGAQDPDIVRENGLVDRVDL